MKTIPIIILVVFAWACSSTEYIDWGNEGERIVVSGQWCDKDTTHRLYVSIVDKTGIRRLDEAQVSVTINGESVPSVFIPYDGRTQPEWRSSCFSFDRVFSSDDETTIHVRYNDLSASAVIHCPTKPDIVSYDTLHISEQRILVNLKLRDLPSVKNYYRMTLYSNDPSDGDGKKLRPTNLDISLDPALGGGSQGEANTALMDFTGQPNSFALFDDTLFQDKEYTLHLAYEPEKRWFPYYLYVYSISYSQFHYLKALEYTFQDPYFYEPVSMPSNIEGGIGFISLDAVEVIKVN